MANEITKEDVVKFIEGMTVLELSELVKELETEVWRKRRGAGCHGCRRGARAGRSGRGEDRV